MESAMAFSYSGLHAQALHRGAEWTLPPDWPPYACWWVPPDHRPDWIEAVARHAALHRNGPTPAVFDFKTAFDPGGQPMAPNRRRMKHIAERNAAHTQ